jgi:hypothetical protein
VKIDSSIDIAGEHLESQTFIWAMPHEFNGSIDVASGSCTTCQSI